MNLPWALDKYLSSLERQMKSRTGQRPVGKGAVTRLPLLQGLQARCALSEGLQIGQSPGQMRWVHCWGYRQCPYSRHNLTSPEPKKVTPS